MGGVKSERVVPDKWWLLIDPDGCWASTEPVKAPTALEAIKIHDEDGVREMGNEWRAYELVGPGFEDFKTSVEVVPTVR
jgi:hypothetical protein